MNCYGNLCLFVPTSFRATGWKLLVLNWRPRRDLKPCYRRESRPRVRNRLKLNGTDSALGHLSDCGDGLSDCDGQVLRSLKIMDSTLLSLLDSITQKSPRSKLETHRELIRQLRRKGCTYRDIVRILHERVGLDVAVSTIHSFIKVRAKHRKQVQYELPPLEPESSVNTRMSPDDVASRIAALKAKPVEQKAKPKHFHFEESEPLKLINQGGSR